MKTQMRLLLGLLILWGMALAPPRAAGYYDPGVQRWINRDPIQEYGGVDVHAFVGNQPTTGVDPEGLGKPSRKPPGNCNKTHLKTCRAICDEGGKEVASCNIKWEMTGFQIVEFPGGYHKEEKWTAFMICICKDPDPPFDWRNSPPCAPLNLQGNLPPPLPPTLGPPVGPPTKPPVWAPILPRLPRSLSVP